MKKTLFFLFGAMLVATLPTAKVDAQTTGHSVTWKNFKCTNLTNAAPTHDTTIFYANDTVAPRLTSPYQDTLLIEWYVDSLLTTPWNFLDDILTSDTTLWPRWQVVGASMGTYHVAYHFAGIPAGTPGAKPDSSSTTQFADIIGSRVVIRPMPFAGFTPVEDSIVIPALPTVDTTVHFHYNRNKYQFVCNLRGGHFTDGSPVVKSHYYGEIVTPSSNVQRDSCTFIGWNRLFYIMPARNLTITARYRFHLIWTMDSTVYNGQPANLFAYYVDDNGQNQPANLTYSLGGVPSSSAVKAGTYTVTATSPNTFDYPFDVAYTTHTLLIKPFNLTLTSLPVVDSVKFYDGSSLANVVTPGAINSFAGTSVALNATARFNDAAVGANKSIVASFSLSGADAANYLVKDTMLVATKGVILNRAHITAPDNYGFCGTTTLNYSYDYSVPSIMGGNLNQYKLTFSADAQANGFTNRDWTNMGATNAITFDIPEQAAGYWYEVSVEFRNSTYPNITSAPQSVYFHTNLPATSVVAIFSNVLSIDNSCNCLTNIQWYKNGAPIPGATGEWYKDESGLNGVYHVNADIYGVPTWSCDSAYTFQRADEAMTVSAYPNPATDIVSITLTNSPDYSHSLMVMNVMGMTVLSTTFDGDDTTIDLRSLPQGSYTVIVDGQTARVIKR